ncbi:MAG TPA: ACT domain-containing protein [Candidatus Polarisedimenticolaceae bacterium]|nr:ACT domain-containing protein [Candidatus Polarisedimenticolaceae bacterium]
MATEFKVSLEDQPGTLARLGSVLGKARVNIEAIHGTTEAGRAVVRFVADDPARAAATLVDAGIPHERRQVLIVRLLDAPGMLGDVALVMADAGINIDSVYVTTSGNMVLGVDDFAGAVQVAGGMAVIAS